MSGVVFLDANDAIMHGRAFPERVRQAVASGTTVILPESVKRELIDDVLAEEQAPANHREAAHDIQALIDEGTLVIRAPDFQTYSSLIDEARRRIADDNHPEHTVKADQYIPALACELAETTTVKVITADKKLQDTIRTIVSRQGVGERVTVHYPRTVL